MTGLWISEGKLNVLKFRIHFTFCFQRKDGLPGQEFTKCLSGAQWLSGRMLNSRLRGCGFELCQPDITEILLTWALRIKPKKKTNKRLVRIEMGKTLIRLLLIE